MVTKRAELAELRVSLARVMRGLWHRRRPSDDLLAVVGRSPRLTRRHVAVLAHVGTEGERTVGELARELGLSLPAASKLTRDLEDLCLVRRREHVDDRRRTVVDLNALTADEREAFLKGLRILGDALMEESGDGPLRSHHRAAHRQRPHRDRPV